MMSNGKDVFCKSVGNLMLIILDLNFGPIRVRMLQKSPFSWSQGAGQTKPCLGWCGPLVHRLTSPLRLFNPSDAKTLSTRSEIHEKFRSAAAVAYEIRRTEVSVLAPCRDGELPPEPSPSTPPPSPSPLLTPRSEERRVGKECRL